MNQVAWTHPRFGHVLASCGIDKKICLWKESTGSKWEKLHENGDHENNVTSINFAPQHFGCILAAGSSDGFISIHEYKSKAKLTIS